MLYTPTLLAERTPDAIARGRTANKLRRAMQHVMTRLPRADHGSDRRRDQRTPYPYLIKLSPVGPDGQSPAGEGIVVVGKHLSAGGIDFYHREPLTHRWMIAWLESGAGALHAVLVELLWCRFNKQGWYDNGGRFVRLIDEAALEKTTEFAPAEES